MTTTAPEPDDDPARAVTAARFARGPAAANAGPVPLNHTQRRALARVADAAELYEAAKIERIDALEAAREAGIRWDDIAAAAGFAGGSTVINALARAGRHKRVNQPREQPGDQEARS